MNIQRNIILIALIVVAYLMIRQWNTDYVQTQSQQQNAVVNEETVSAAVPAAPTPAATSDVPVQPSSTPAAVSAAASAESTQLIQVETDLFSIKIDPLGGDIIYVGLKQYPQSKDDHKPFILLNRTKDHTFIAQSGLVGEDGTDDASGKRPLFSAAKTEFSLADGSDTLEVALNLTQASGAQITKTYVFKRDSYKIDLRYDVKNVSAKNWKAYVYTQLKRDNASDPSVTNGLSSMPTYLGAAYWTPEKPFEKIKFDDFAEKAVNINHKGGWLAVVQHYFVTAWVANADTMNQFKTSKAGDNHVFAAISPMIDVAAGQDKNFQVSFYAGPKIQKVLAEVSPGLELSVDYGILFFIAKILFWLLTFWHGLIGNWGIAIILLTVTVKAVFYWPSKVSYTSMAKMRKIGPRMQELKERFGDDRAAMSQAMMKMYQEEKVNPFGGCLPILIQMPVFIALYWVLLESVELRQAPFYGWINDLSAMDPYFVLPILMTLSMFVQQKLNPAPPDPMQAQMMKWMPLIFGVMFLWFPSGLVLYWVTNNVLSIAQQWTITRAIEREEKLHPYAHHKK